MNRRKVRSGIRSGFVTHEGSLRLWASLALALCLLQCVQADDVSGLRQRLDEVEKGLREMVDGLAEKQGEAVTAGAGSVKLSGFSQALYRGYDGGSANDTFKLPRVRLKADGRVMPDVTYRVQIDAAASSGILRDAYIAYAAHPAANVLVGQTFIPFSEEMLYPTAEQEFIDFSEAVSALSYDRDIGVQLCGEVLDEKLTYGLGVFNGSGKNASDNNSDKDVVGRVVVSPWKGGNIWMSGLSLGAAVQTGKQPLDEEEESEGERRIAGFLAKYTKGKWKLQGEYLLRKQERVAELRDKESDGWYAMAACHLLPKLQAAIRHSRFDPDREAGGDRSDTLTLGLNCFCGDRAKLQANYLIREDQAREAPDEIALQLQVKY